MTRQLKHAARRLKVPILCLAQLNRQADEQRPRLAHLRESGAIEQDADVVMFIYREDAVAPSEENSGVAEIIVGKQRNGPTGSFQLAFIKQFTKFANLWQGSDE